jgi:hypothetical protein
MVSFAEQNTLLMEHLASHGYVVFGINHTYTSMRVVSADGRVIYPDFDRINEASAQFRLMKDGVTPRIERASSPEERTRLQLELYERASGNNELMQYGWMTYVSCWTQSMRHPAGIQNYERF